MGFQMVAGLDFPPCSALSPLPWPVGRQAGESYKSTFCLMCRDARGGVAALLLLHRAVERSGNLKGQALQ
jgi:hypothetical protein